MSSLFRSALLKAAVCGFVFAATFGHALAQTPGERGLHMGPWGDGGYGHMFFGGFMMLLFWVALIALIAVAVRWVASGTGGVGGMGGGGSLHARQNIKHILDERFARGEIDKAEFEDRKKALGL